MSHAVSGADPSDTAPASEAAIDAIAAIEVQRREMEKEAGLAASCSSALRKLHELLDREKEAVQLHGAVTGHPANVDAVAIEIDRVKRLAVIKVQGPAPKKADPAWMQPGSRQKPWQNTPRNPARSKGRRTMGRAGGR